MKFITILSFVISSSLLAIPNTTHVINEAPIQISVPLNPVLEGYLDKLAICESSNDPKRINPKDLDGTPSLGRYQFKPSTFDMFSAKYGIATTSIWNGDEQRDVVREMAKDPQVDFHRQFPGCTHKLGLPPT